MSDTFRCDDKDTLIAYLYDEIDAERRRQVDEHLRICAACADEVGGLAGVRMGLAAWAPPQPEFGFTVVAKAAGDAPGAEAVPPASRWAEVPVWAQLAAAVLVLAVGLSIANVQVRSGPDGFVVTTGWMAPASVAPMAPASGAIAATAATAAPESWKPALTALESQLRQEIRAARAADGAVARASAPVPAGSADAMLNRVQEMLDASETRQKRELALRLTQFNRDVNVQRQADLVRIDQLIGQMDGRTGAEIARQRQMVNYLMRVSQPQQ